MLNLSPDVSGRLELALWSPAATQNEFAALFEGARKFRVRAVCVPSSRVALACSRLEDSDVKVVALAGFPLGNADSDVKRFEAEAAIDNGAQELEIVANHGLLKEGDYKAALREFRDIVETADERSVILAAELAWLSEQQTVDLCHLALDAGIAGITTGTGFWSGTPPTAAQVQLIRNAGTPKFIIKAAPLADEAMASAMLAAGADRLGLIFGSC